MRSAAFLLPLALFLPTATTAEHPPSDEPVVRLSARPVERRAPRYPQNEARRGSQGWVLLNFVVQEDGSVGDPIVEDSSGVLAFERAALRATERWEYTPATVDGEPVEQCHTQVVIAFDGPKGWDGLGGTRSFRTGYRKVIEHLGNGREDEARAALDALAQKKRLNRYEGARISLMRARFAAIEGDSAARLHWLLHATRWGNDPLEPELLESVLTQVFALQVQQRKYANALQTWDTLQNLDEPPELPEELVRAQRQILELRESDQALTIAATIPAPRDQDDTLGVWQHKLLRRMPGLRDIEGSLERVEVRCPWQRVTAKPGEGKAWRIPEEWGSCDIFVFGEPGVSFTLVEYPADTEGDPAAG